MSLARFDSVWVGLGWFGSFWAVSSFIMYAKSLLIFIMYLASKLKDTKVIMRDNLRAACPLHTPSIF